MLFVAPRLRNTSSNIAKLYGALLQGKHWRKLYEAPNYSAFSFQFCEEKLRQPTPVRRLRYMLFLSRVEDVALTELTL